jgi:hypothetical protein
MEFLGTYRGAGLYKVIEKSDLPDKDIEIRKIRGAGIDPTKDNEKIEFIGDADSKEKALKKVIEQINDYLDDRDLEEFDFDQLDQD